MTGETQKIFNFVNFFKEEKKKKKRSLTNSAPVSTDLSFKSSLLDEILGFQWQLTQFELLFCAINWQNLSQYLLLLSWCFHFFMFLIALVAFLIAAVIILIAFITFSIAMVTFSFQSCCDYLISPVKFFISYVSRHVFNFLVTLFIALF